MAKLHLISALVCSLVLLSACSRDGGPNNEKDGAGRNAQRPGGEKDKPASITAAYVTPHDFVDALEAVGTAYARESVTLTADVTDRIKALRFQDGQYVRKGQILVELAQAEENANLSQARARLKETESQLARVQSLVKDGYATRARLEEQTATRDSARGEVASLEARVQDRFIRAPFDGVVGLRRISEGLMASSSTPILELSDTSQIKLDFAVPETALSAVRRGQNIQAIAAAYPDDRFAGQIDAIDPRIDPVTRAVSLRARIPNASGRLKPGMLLTVKIEQSRRSSLAVPEQAIVAEGDLKFIYKIDAAQKAVERVAVTTGAREPGLVEITGGIAAGAMIVVDGTVKLRDGAKIEISQTGGQKQSAVAPTAPGTIAR
jgi:membrane fusion protein, multidrug efflux system